MCSLILLADQIVETTWLTQAEHLTLTGALIIAVVILWKSLDKKDALLIESSKIITTALNSAAASNIELRKIIEESVKVKESLRVSIDKLATLITILPCNDNEDEINRPGRLKS